MANKVQIKSELEAVLDRPDTYIGSIKTVTEEHWVVEDEMIVYKPIEYNMGLERIYLEILSNATDNAIESKEEGIKASCINITIQDDTVSIENDGKHIPITKNNYTLIDDFTKKREVISAYTPEVIFGKMNSSTNYDDTVRRVKIGKNGKGAKLTNAFSTYFVVECIDPDNKLQYIQAFRDNMRVREQHKITQCKRKGMTRITFTPDYKRFGMNGLSDDMLMLFKKYAYDAAMITKIRVTFNGHALGSKSLLEYSKLYMPSEFNHIKLQSEDSEFILVEQNIDDAKRYGFRHVSFVNGMQTLRGGIHVDTWCKALLGEFVTYINKKLNQRFTLNTIKSYLMVFLNCSLDKPTFDTQTKECLRSPAPTVVLPANTTTLFNKLCKWNFVTELENTVNKKELKKITATDGKKLVNINIGSKYHSANLAGRSQSSQCTLILCEGLSAKSMVMTGISSIPKGNDLYGVFALKGKVINATNNTELKVNDNEEVKQLKKVLGLRHGTDYRIEANYKTLRYGKVWLLCDADVDGYHIEGLVLDYFYEQFPSLFHRNFITAMRTPLVKVKYGNQTLSFYRDKDFKSWYNTKDNRKCDIKYYKGLATSTNQEAKEAFKVNKLVNYKSSNNVLETMKLAFDKKYANKRKEWLTTYSPDGDVIVDDEVISREDVVEGDMSIHSFVYNKLVLYHLSNIRRSIPSIYSGLKESQHKIMYGSFMKFKSPSANSIKVEQLVGYISEHTGYHHGPASLEGAIIGMAQGFVGANNIPLFVNDGQFGSRLGGGSLEPGKREAGSSRYIFTKLEPIAYKLFRKEDFDLLDRVEDDGEILEPKHYMPILPMILINGAEGIASGFSTKIPQYNPIDIIENIKLWLDGVELNEMIPWYRGFNGTIEVNGHKITTHGVYKQIKPRTYEITELPIHTWTNDYDNYINALIDHGYIIDKHTYHTNNSVHYIITVSPEFQVDESNLKLTSLLHTSNMYLLNIDLVPEKFDSVNDILSDYCEVRYTLYEKRKLYQLSALKQQLLIQRNKYRFTGEVITKKVVMFNVDIETLNNTLKERKYDTVNDSYSYLVDMKMRSFTKEKQLKFESKIKSLLDQIQILINKTIKDIWLDDINEFMIEYNKLIQVRHENQG